MRAVKKSRNSNDTTIPLLKELVRSSHQQQTSQIPTRPDVQSMPKSKRDRIYSFTQSYVGANITTSNAAETDGTFIFSLSVLSNVASFATIFDKYRIRQVKVCFFPFAIEGVITSGTTAGPVYTVLDYDDATAVNINGLVNYDNLKVAPLGAYFERTLTPHCATNVYNGAFGGFGNAPNLLWLDMANTNTQYYGLKWGTPISTVASGTVLFNTLVTLELEFSHPR